MTPVERADMTTKLIGIILLIAGLALLLWGYNISQSIGSQFEQAFTGSPGDKPMLLYIGGGILAAAGIFQILRK